MAAPATAKKTGMMWHRAVAASSAAAQARYLPVSSPLRQHTQEQHGEG